MNDAYLPEVDMTDVSTIPLRPLTIAEAMAEKPCPCGAMHSVEPLVVAADPTTVHIWHCSSEFFPPEMYALEPEDWPDDVEVIGDQQAECGAVGFHASGYDPDIYRCLRCEITCTACSPSAGDAA